MRDRPHRSRRSIRIAIWAMASIGSVIAASYGLLPSYVRWAATRMSGPLPFRVTRSSSGRRWVTPWRSQSTLQRLRFGHGSSRWARARRLLHLRVGRPWRRHSQRGAHRSCAATLGDRRQDPPDAGPLSRIEPQRSLVFRQTLPNGFPATWAFLLVPRQDGTTRLLTRERDNARHGHRA